MKSIPPIEPKLDPEDPRTQLRNRVKEALLALPGYFSSPTNIEGMLATDLFSLNALLGTTLEVQVVNTLNRIREVWDPEEKWPLHRFVRQAQTFPDVLLRRQYDSGEYDVALGIELKGWYLLAKEAEASFRYTATPLASSEWDLLAVIPWHLSNILSGTPIVLPPGIWSARHIANLRNYWWQHIRRTKAERDIISPEVETRYLQRKHMTDKPTYDRGGNFGRIARIQVMDNWTNETLAQPLAGIPAHDWITFLTEHKT